MSEEQKIPEENYEQNEVNENIEQLQTKNMEAHHPHHITHKKKWTEYLLEFFMLFLAVFLGFLAENFRENIVEHRRAKEYAKSLLTDLKNDTADINKAAFFDSTTTVMIDSLVLFVSSDDVLKKSGQCYYYMRLAGWFYSIDWSKATINQLINSGNLRYFTNTELVTKISVYNTTANGISDIQEGIKGQRDRASSYTDHMLKPQYASAFLQLRMDDLYAGKRSGVIDSLRNIDLPFQNNDPDLLNSYTNAILGTKSNRSFLLNTLYPRAKKEAVEIIQLLNDEYHLPNE